MRTADGQADMAKLTVTFGVWAKHLKGMCYELKKYINNT
jgi:hypothetical protein